MRDIHRQKEYFETVLESQQKFSKTFDEYISLYNDDSRFPLDQNGFRKLTALTTGFTEGFVRDIALKYCLGESLSNIHKDYIESGLDRYAVLADELAKGHPSKYIFRPNNKTPYTYHSIYTLLSWFVCFGGKEEKIKKISPYLCEEGKDRIVDTILSRYEPGRKIAKSAAVPKTFGLLEKIIDSNADDRILLVQQYLDYWPVYMGHFDGLKSIGINGTSKVKSKDDLIANAVNGSHKYFGLWAWEVALVVKFFDIKDESFRDNEFYPDDVASFTL